MLNTEALNGIMDADLEAIDSLGGGPEGAKANFARRGVDPEAVNEFANKVVPILSGLPGDSGITSAFRAGMALGLAVGEFSEDQD